jgi:hypothetical protein
LFASGGGSGSRIVQKSGDHGQTWKLLDTVPFPDANPICNFGNVAVDSKGVLYSAGSCDFEGWLVRRSTDGGATWVNVGDFFTLVPGQPARFADLHIGSDDAVFVAGTAQDSMSVGHWIVRRLDSGNKWTIVDNYQLDVGQGGSFRALAGSSKVYAVGTMDSTAVGAVGGAVTKHWIIRRADADGSTWKTLDDWTYSNALAVVATGVYEGPNGKLVAVGSVTDASGVARVITRRSNDDGTTWIGAEEWTLAPGKSSAPGELVADAQGNVYGTVRAIAADDHAHWLVRRLSCSP